MAVLAVFDQECMGRRQLVLDAWSALPGTGRESKGGELGGTSKEHEEGIPEGPASFHRAAHEALSFSCHSATLFGQFAVRIFTENLWFEGLAWRQMWA